MKELVFEHTYQKFTPQCEAWFMLLFEGIV